MTEKPQTSGMIDALISELPDPGEIFSIEKQEAWINLAQAVFALVYLTEKPERKRRSDSGHSRSEPEPAPARTPEDLSHMRTPPVHEPFDEGDQYGNDENME